jgi:hypothetical protein
MNVFKSLCCVALFTVVLLPCSAQQETAGVSLIVPAEAVLVGHELEAAKWPRKLLEEPSAEGQFEVLIRKSAQSIIEAPACRRPYLLARMPGVPSTDPAFARNVEARKQIFDELINLSKQHHSMTFRLVAGGYGRIDSHGKLQLTGCNVWFAKP